MSGKPDRLLGFSFTHGLNPSMVPLIVVDTIAMSRNHSELPNDLRKTLLLKLIAKTRPTDEEIEGVIELTAAKAAEAVQAQSITLYLLDGNEVAFRYVYYSPSLWDSDPSREKEFQQKRETLLKMRIPTGQGIVGKVISTGDPAFYSEAQGSTRPIVNLFRDTGFHVSSMLTVPLRSQRIVGALQVLNKEPGGERVVFSTEDLDLLKEVAEYSGPLLQRLIDPDYALSPEDVAKFIARYTGTPLVTSADDIKVDEKLLEVVGDAIIRRERVFPYRRLSPSSVAVLMADPFDYSRRERFSDATELHLDEVSVAPQTLLDELMERHFSEDAPEAEPQKGTDFSELANILGMEYGKSDSGSVSADDFDSEESAPIIQLANRIIEDAYISGSSDIHIEPQEHDLLVRYRIDGVLEERLRLPVAVAAALTARLKVMSELDIAERRMPQDGRIVFKRFTRRNIDIDLRVATGPMNFGEKIVMRILDKTKSALPITALGFSEENLVKYRQCIVQPYGMILHCGPTGSGKSMTLFSALREVAGPDINVQTAEDPIEYTIPGINQMQMKKEIGLTFARALRCYLRMDPDVILVGEIRDQETAEIAVEAALTGHLLLSTLHTNDAPSTVARLTDMEIEPFMVSASLLAVCSQRLIRRVCKDCRQTYTPEGNEKDIMERAIGWSGEIYKASADGCMTCGGHRYKGRTGIHELMVNNDDLTRAMNSAAETAVLKQVARDTGMTTLHEDSMDKVRQGMTTIVEALATVPTDSVAGKTKAKV